MIQIYRKTFYKTDEKSSIKCLNEFLSQFEDNELIPIKFDSHISGSKEDFDKLIVTFRSNKIWSSYTLSEYNLYE